MRRSKDHKSDHAAMDTARRVPDAICPIVSALPERDPIAQTAASRKEGDRKPDARTTPTTAGGIGSLQETGFLSIPSRALRASTSGAEHSWPKHWLSLCVRGLIANAMLVLLLVSALGAIRSERTSHRIESASFRPVTSAIGAAEPDPDEVNSTDAIRTVLRPITQSLMISVSDEQQQRWLVVSFPEMLEQHQDSADAEACAGIAAQTSIVLSMTPSQSFMTNDDDQACRLTLPDAGSPGIPRTSTTLKQSPANSNPVVPVDAAVECPSDGMQRHFRIPFLNGSHSTSCLQTCDCVLQGDRIDVFAAESATRLFRDVAGRPVPEAQCLATWLNAELLPRLESRFGRIPDLDGSGRLSVVFADLGDVSDGHPLRGIVRPADFRDSVCLRESTIPDENHTSGDIVYLSPQILHESGARSIVAHEVMHAVICGRRSDAGLAPVDSWIQEGLAHWAESQYGDGTRNLDDRVTAFRRKSWSRPLVISERDAPRYWRDPACRGAAFLFVKRFAERFGDDGIARVIMSERPDQLAFADACGVSFRELFLDWARSEALASPGGGHRTPAVRPVDWEHSDEQLEVVVSSSSFALVRLPTLSSGDWKLSAAIPAGTCVQVQPVP